MEISPSLLGLIGFGLLFVLIFLRMPIALAFGFIGLFGLLTLTSFKATMSLLISTVWTYATSYVLMAVPLFVLMGMFVYQSGVGPELYNSAEKWLGRLPGGLALATNWGCAVFGAVTGSSTAGILTFGPIAFKPMLEHKYDRRLALGTLCCGATMGQIIPPSINFIVYGTITEESVGRLFMAGLFPGIIEAILYSVVIITFAGLGIWAGPPGLPSTWREKLISLKGVWLALLLFLIVIGGIYMGVFTPTEASAVGAFGAAVVLISRKGFKLELFKAATRDALRTACMVFTIVIGSLVFARFIALSGLSFQLVDWLLGLDMNPYGILAMTLFCYLILGCLMPALPMIVLTVPLLFPVFVEGFGFSGIWFGVLVCVMMEIAFITPPIGINLFVTHGLLREEAPMGALFMGVLPFALSDMVRMVILVAFPAISLWLPNLMYNR